MKAALWYKSGDIRIEDIPEPSPCAGEVKIKVKWCGICGSDLHEFTMGPIFIPVENPHPITQEVAPVIMGHLLMDQFQFFCGHPKQNRHIPLALCHGYRSGSRFFGAADL